jgi:hypothetical protein
MVVAGLPRQPENYLRPKPVISTSFKDLGAARLLKRHQNVYVLPLDERAKVLAFDERDSIRVSLASGYLPFKGCARRQFARILCSLRRADRPCQARQNCYDQNLMWKSHLFASLLITDQRMVISHRFLFPVSQTVEPDQVSSGWEHPARERQVHFVFGAYSQSLSPPDLLSGRIENLHRVSESCGLAGNV